MPLYAYKCDKCGREVERIEKSGAPKEAACPTEGCEGTEHRVLSAPAPAQFKGDGFYANSYPRTRKQK